MNERRKRKKNTWLVETKTPKKFCSTYLFTDFTPSILPCYTPFAVVPWRPCGREPASGSLPLLAGRRGRTNWALWTTVPIVRRWAQSLPQSPPFSRRAGTSPHSASIAAPWRVPTTACARDKTPSAHCSSPTPEQKPASEPLPKLSALVPPLPSPASLLLNLSWRPCCEVSGTPASLLDFPFFFFP